MTELGADGRLLGAVLPLNFPTQAKTGLEWGTRLEMGRELRSPDSRGRLSPREHRGFGADAFTDFFHRLVGCDQLSLSLSVFTLF